MSKTTDYVIDVMNEDNNTNNNIEHTKQQDKQTQNAYDPNISNVLFNAVKTKVLVTKCIVCGDSVVANTNLAKCKTCM